jgi:hypothetical protein
MRATAKEILMPHHLESAPSPKTPASLLLCVLAGLSGLACGSDPPRNAPDEPAVKEGPGTKNIAVLVDVSGSIAASDVPRWRSRLDQRLLDMAPGDALVMLAIGRRSAEAAPLFEAVSKPLIRARGRKEFVKARSEFMSIRQRAGESFSAALANPTSAGTDIFGALARVGARTSHLVVFSDMLHSDPHFDMERRRLRRDEIPRLVERLAADGLIKPGALADARVSVYLTTTGIDDRQRARVDRETLRRFWAAVFAKLGAELDYFDNGAGHARNG